MEFCEKCGTLMLPKKEKDKTIFVCPSCGVKQQGGTAKITEKTTGVKKVVAVDKQASEVMPKHDEECPTCGHKEAYFRTEQTRAADEPETLFFTCVKCGKMWREYE